MVAGVDAGDGVVQIVIGEHGQDQAELLLAQPSRALLAEVSDDGGLDETSRRGATPRRRRRWVPAPGVSASSAPSLSNCARFLDGAEGGACRHPSPITIASASRASASLEGPTSARGA